MFLKNWSLARVLSKLQEGSKKKSVKVLGHKKNILTMSLSISTSMMRSKAHCGYGNSFPEAIKRDGAGWAEEVGQ
jgi:hypothetical protein